MINDGISLAIIKRLPKYYRYLSELLEKGVERVSSRELSDQMELTASQIRQDFNHFGGFGQQGYGYNVRYLHQEIGKILGLDHRYNCIIVGAGNLGQALAHYEDFARRGFVINRIFDINPRLVGMTIRGIEISDVADMEAYVRENQVDIAALTVPRSAAQEIATDLAAWGVRGIWNFAPIDLTVPPEVQVETVHLSESLMRLSYSMQAADIAAGGGKTYEGKSGKKRSGGSGAVTGARIKGGASDSGKGKDS